MVKLGAVALLLACSGRTVTPVDDADGSGSGGSMTSEGSSTSQPTTASSGADTSSGGETNTPGEEGEMPPPIDDAARPIIVRIDDGTTTWSWIGEAEHRIWAEAVDVDGSVFVAKQAPEQGLTLNRFESDGVGSSAAKFLTDEGSAYDIGVHPDSNRIVVAGNIGTSLGYWLFDHQLEEVAPFVELYDVALGEARVARVALDADGSFVIVGGHADLETRWMKRIDAAGEIVWEDTWPQSLAGSEPPSLAGIALAPDGTFALALATQSLKGPGIGIEAFDANGSSSWTQPIATTTIGGVARRDDGTFVVAGRDDESLMIALHGFASDGTPAWNATTDITGLGAVEPCGPDHVVVTPTGTAFLRTFIFDAVGTMVDAPEHVEPDAETTADDAFCTSDGGVVIIGHLSPQ